MTRTNWSVACLLPVLAACSVGAEQTYKSQVAVNDCEQDSDCPSGSCDDGICHVGMGKLTSLLVAVTPPTVQAGLANVTYFQTLPQEGGSTIGPGGSGLPIKLAPAIDFDSTVKIDTTNGCIPGFDKDGAMIGPDLSGHIPADVTFTPTQHSLGLRTDSYTSTLHPRGYEFIVSVPPGDYDVYVTPHYKLMTPDCPVPPRLLLNQSVQKNVEFTFPPPSVLTVDVTWPLGPADVVSGDPLQGWKVDLIDPNSGRVLSTQETLPAPILSADGTLANYEVIVTHSPIYTTEKGAPVPQGIGHELIRLKPPDFIQQTDTPYPAPIVYAQVDGALLDASATSGGMQAARIVEKDPLLWAVNYSFTTALAGTVTPVPSAVTFTAAELAGFSGISTKFSRTVPVGADGSGSVALLPGHYRVTAQATAGCDETSCLASASAEWIVLPDVGDQSGQVIEFAPSPRLAGQAFVPPRDPAVGAAVRALGAASLLDSTVLNLGDGSSPILPRASAGLVDRDGTFFIDAEPGLFDFSVRPDPNTGYGWFVHPHLRLPDESTLLESVALSVPVAYWGTVSFDLPSGSTPLPGALIKAYVYVTSIGVFTSKPGTDSSAVQVAETQTDEAGNFRLLLPQVLDTSP